MQSTTLLVDPPAVLSASSKLHVDRQSDRYGSCVLWILDALICLPVVAAALAPIFSFKIWRLTPIDSGSHQAYTVLGIVGLLILGLALQESGLIDVFEIGGIRAEFNQIRADALVEVEQRVEELTKLTEQGLLDCVSRGDLTIVSGCH